jgi:hypothetical protein
MYEQKIQDFYRVATTRKFSRDYQLRVNYFSVPGIGELFGPDDLVYIKSASLPGRRLDVIKAPYMGVNFNVPGLVTYTNSESWSVTFYCDEELQLRQKLEVAQNSNFSAFNSIGDLSLPDDTCRIELNVINDKFEVVAQYLLIGAFITDLGSIEYRMTGNGGLQEIKATIAYQFWQGAADKSFISVDRGGALGFLDRIARGAQSISQAAGAVGGLAGSLSQAGSTISRAFRR